MKNKDLTVCMIVHFLASLPATAPPLESAPSETSVKLVPAKQESLPATDESKDPPAPKPDPDAWIQVEKRHRQASGKLKVAMENREEVRAS